MNDSRKNNCSKCNYSCIFIGTSANSCNNSWYESTHQYFLAGNECKVYGEMEVSIFCFLLLQVVNIVYVYMSHREYIVTPCEFYYDIFPTPENKGQRLQVLKDISHFLTLLATICSGFFWISASNVKYLVCLLVSSQDIRALSQEKYQNLNVWVAVLLFSSSIFSGIAKAFHDYLIKKYPNLKVGTKDDDEDQVDKELNEVIKESSTKVKPEPSDGKLAADKVSPFDVEDL